MLNVEQAWDRIRGELEALPAERVALADAAGRVLAETLMATTAVPQANVSAMDGYALAGPTAADAQLSVAGTIAAGPAPTAPHPGPGHALRIMTGAVLPVGADRVLPVELATEEAASIAPIDSADPLRHSPHASRDRLVRTRSTVTAGAHVRWRAEVLAPGDPLLTAGHHLGPAALGLLASQGITEVSVVGRPRIALLATGDEVVPANSLPGPGELRDSHTAFLAAACAEIGLPTTSLGIAPDEPRTLREALARGLGEAEVLLVCGGVSMGMFDLVEGLLAELGVEILVDSVAIQPGKPLVIGRRRAAQGGPRWVFGLPGNPASVMTCTYLFVRPALRILAGQQAAPWDDGLPGRLAGSLPPTGPRERFFPARRRRHAGELWLTPLVGRGSHDLLSFARADALLRQPAHSPAAGQGSPCSWIDLGLSASGRGGEEEPSVPLPSASETAG